MISRNHAANERRRVAIVHTILDFWGRRGRAPTRGEVAKALDLSRDTVERHVRALQTDGVLAEGRQLRMVEDD